MKHAIATSNATVALEIAARALGLSGEVILPSYTFIAAAHALQWQGITPVFADIDPSTHQLDPEQIEPLITPRTTGILGVHLWGRACDTGAIEEIAAKHRLKVLYDASHAFGCSNRSRMIGSFGDCEVFSFHATKFIHTLEGGAVTTQDDSLAERLRRIRNFGFEGFDTVVELGLNGKMNEISAAMGLTNLEAIDDITRINRRNYLAYRRALATCPGVSVMSYDPCERHNYQYVVIEVDPSICPETRDGIVAALHARGVIARKYFWPGCHRMEPYRTLQPDASQRLPETERVAARVIVLPTGQTVEEEDVLRVCRIIQEAVAGRLR